MGLVTLEVTQARLTLCKACQFWVADRCQRGHPVSSPTGCPLHTFPPVAGAGYAPDLPKPGGSKTCCGQRASTLSTIVGLADTLRRWQKAGYPMADKATLDARLKMCDACPNYHGGVCGLCNCVVYLKSRLKTAACPDGRW